MCVCVFGALKTKGPFFFFIDFLITLENKVGKCTNKPKGIVEKRRGESHRRLGVSSPPDPGAVLCVCLVSAQSVSPVAVCG